MLPGCRRCHPLHSLEFFHWISRHPGFAKDFAHIIQSKEYDQFTRELAGHLSPALQSADQIVLDLFEGKREPHRVHQLFFSDDAVTAWRRHFASLSPAPYRVTYDAVFVHQKPYVRFSGGRCELGDVLLLLVDSFDKRLYAQFLQAKMFDEWPPNTNHAQWKLYTKWPEFKYTPRPGDEKTCDLRFPGPVGSAKYLLLDDFEKRVWLNNAVIGGAALTMSEQVTNYFAGHDVRPVSWVGEQKKNDWDRLIWDLIEYTAQCALPSRQVGGATGSRGTWIQDRLNFATGSNLKVDHPEWGISLIVVESGFSAEGEQGSEG
jgi:hypothetical protein